MRARRSTAARQGGATTLVITLLLFFAMALAGAYANRTLLIEQRASAAQVRATISFEAAEAGLEWAIAMLNSDQAVDEACQSSAAPGARPFRERFLQYDAALGTHVPRRWAASAGDPPQPLQAACQKNGAEGWSCSCPTSGLPTSSPSDAETPAFSLQFAALPRAGLLQLSAVGCADRAACRPGAVAWGESRSRMQVTLALVGALRTRPLAALTAAGDVDAGSAPVGFRNADAMAGGRAVHAGGSVAAPAARLATAPGGSPLLSVASGDTALQALGAERLFVRHFGLDKAAWREQSAVRRLACEASDCSLQLAAAAAAARMVWVDGDLRIDSPLTLGSAERPLAIAASGAIRLNGAASVHGVLYGASLQWNDAPAGTASLRGAAIAEGAYSGNGAPEFVYDAGVLSRLQHDTGSYVRVPGSWRDF